MHLKTCSNNDCSPFNNNFKGSGGWNTESNHASQEGQPQMAHLFFYFKAYCEDKQY